MRTVLSLSIAVALACGWQKSDAQVVVNALELDGVSGFRINGDLVEDRLGRSVDAAGDVNGDGIDDLIVGALLADANGQTDSGESYVVFGRDGSQSGFSPSINVTSLDGANGFRIKGIAADDFSGNRVRGVGDINGDDIDDILIGAAGADPSGLMEAGAVYLVFGRDSQSGEMFPAELQLSDLDGSTGFAIEGLAAGEMVGHATVADLNGDNLNDLILGASNGDPEGRMNAGKCYVVFADAMLGGIQPGFDLGQLNGTNGFVINGASEEDLLCFYLDSAGDVNSDGVEDLIVGALLADTDDGVDAGQSYVIFGADGGSFPAVMELSGLNGTNGFSISGAFFEGRAATVRGIGDFNGDGMDDIAIGAAFEGGVSEGFTYIVFGRAQTEGPVFAANIDLSDLDGSNGVAIRGEADFGLSGFGLDGAGDVNGDGLQDVIIGALFARTDPTAPSPIGPGRAYVLFGIDNQSGAELPALVQLSDLNGGNGFIINGIDVRERAGQAVAGIGDINDDGFDDVMVGAPSLPESGPMVPGAAYVVFGGGRPRFDSEPLERAVVDQPYIYQPTATGVDPDDVLTFEVVGPLPVWMSFVTGAGLTQLQGVPSVADIGTVDVRLRVASQNGASADQFISVSVLPENVFQNGFE